MTPSLPFSFLTSYGQRLLRLLVIGLLLAGSRISNAQTAPSWQTVASAVNIAPPSTNDPVDSEIIASATDANGNVIVVGRFSGTVSFGSTTLNALTNTGYETFVAKWSPGSNSWVWAKQSTTTATFSIDSPTAVVVNGSSIYISGVYDGLDVSFGNVTLNQPNPGDYTGYLVKMTDAGSTVSFIWAQQVQGGASNKSVAVNGSNVYVCGEFLNASATIGSITLSNANTSGTSATSNLYVAKYSDAGNSASVVWAQGAGINNIDDHLQAMSINGTAVYLLGSTSGAARFGSYTIPSTSLYHNAEDPFLARIDDLGSIGLFAWAQRIGYSSARYVGTAVYKGATSTQLMVNSGNLYVTGYFFGASFINNGGTLVNSDNTGFTADTFIMKLADTGTSATVTWTLQAGTVGSDISVGLAVSGNNIYLGTTFNGPTAQYGTTPAINNIGNVTGTSDLALVKILDAGTSASYVWARPAGGPLNDAIGSVIINGNTIYVSGSVSPPTLFGSQTITNTFTAPQAFLTSVIDGTIVLPPC